MYGRKSDSQQFGTQRENNEKTNRTKLVTAVASTKPPLVLKMTTLGIEEIMGHLAMKRRNFKEPLRIPIKPTD